MSEDEIRDAHRVLEKLVDRYPKYSYFLKLCIDELGMSTERARTCLAILMDYELISVLDPRNTSLTLARANYKGLQSLKSSKSLKGYLDKKENEEKYQRALTWFRYYTYWPLVVITLISLAIAVYGVFNETDSPTESRYLESHPPKQCSPVPLEVDTVLKTNHRTDSIGEMPIH